MAGSVLPVSPVPVPGIAWVLPPREALPATPPTPMREGEAALVAGAVALKWSRRDGLVEAALAVAPPVADVKFVFTVAVVDNGSVVAVV